MRQFDALQIQRLTIADSQRKGESMNIKLLLMPLVAAAALAGCDIEPEVVKGDGPYDPQKEAAGNATVELPPSIVASHKYRCKDNSVVSIDWLSNGKVNSARVTPAGQPAVNLTQAPAAAPAEGEAAPAEPGDYVAEGMTLKGDPQAASITLNGQACRK
jgi:hypothetical protein